MKKLSSSFFIFLGVLKITSTSQNECSSKPSNKLTCVPSKSSASCILEEYDTIGEIVALNLQDVHSIKSGETKDIPLDVNFPGIKWRTKKNTCENWSEWSPIRNFPLMTASGLRYLVGPNEIQFKRDTGVVEIWLYSGDNTKVIQLDDKKDSEKIKVEPGTVYSFQFKNCISDSKECTELSNYFKIYTPLGNSYCFC